MYAQGHAEPPFMGRKGILWKRTIAPREKIVYVGLLQCGAARHNRGVPGPEETVNFKVTVRVPAKFASHPSGAATNPMAERQPSKTRDWATEMILRPRFCRPDLERGRRQRTPLRLLCGGSRG